MNTITWTNLKKIPPQEKRRSISCGGGLEMRIESISKGGGKSFAGRMRFRSNQRTVWIGSIKKINLKQARQEFEKIKIWSAENDKDPKEYKKRGQLKKSNKTFKSLIDAYLKERTDIKERTLINYKRQLNQAMEFIGSSTSITDLEWDLEGRRLVMELNKFIESRGSFSQAYRVQNTLHRLFDYAISKGWMRRNQNPAIAHKAQPRKHQPKNNPSITWEQVPKFLIDLEENKCNASPVTVLAVKTLLMTFLRAGALVRLEWDWFDEEKDCLIIPSQTAGLKRRKGVNDKPHHIPITEPLREVLRQVHKYTGQQKYIFWSFRGGEFAHISRELPNKHLINLGYKGLLTAHGWRQLPLTAGQDELHCDAEIIRRQMGHLIGDKTQKAYDKSIALKERKEFMNAWCNALIEKGLKI